MLEDFWLNGTSGEKAGEAAPCPYGAVVLFFRYLPDEAFSRLNVFSDWLQTFSIQLLF
jgi:hypothetical protein